MMTRKPKFVSTSRYVASGDNQGWNIAARHKFVPSTAKIKRQPASVEGRTGAIAKMAFLTKRKIENFSLPGRNREIRNEQERINFTSIRCIRLGSSFTTSQAHNERKTSGRRVKKLATNDKLKWSFRKLHKTWMDVRIVNASFGWLTQSKGSRTAVQSTMKNSMQNKPKVSPSTCNFPVPFAVLDRFWLTWTKTGPAMKAAGTATVWDKNVHVGDKRVMQLTAFSDWINWSKEIKLKASKIDRKVPQVFYPL